MDTSPRTHYRRGAPATSREAAETVDIAAQAFRVLKAYADGRAIIDHEAYRLAGLSMAINGARPRCSDLRNWGYIARTGDRGITPSGKTGYLCRITPRGLAYLKAMSGTNSLDKGRTKGA